MANVERVGLTPATIVFDPEDAFLRRRGTHGPHPRPLASLLFRLVARMVGGVRQAASPPLELVAPRTTGGYHPFLDSVVLPDGSRRRLDLEPGTYIVRIESSAYRPTEVVNVGVPAAGPVFADLEPGYAYQFPTEALPGGGGPTLLRGSSLGPGGEGIADARVEALGTQASPYVTDDSGQWVLVFPDAQPSGNVTVRIRQPDGTVLDVQNVGVVSGGDASLPLTALRGFVVRAGSGIAGASVRASGLPGVARTTADGAWRYVFPVDQANTNVTLTAELSDGSSQGRPNVAVQARTTQDVPVFNF